MTNSTVLVAWQTNAAPCSEIVLTEIIILNLVIECGAKKSQLAIRRSQGKITVSKTWG